MNRKLLIIIGLAICLTLAACSPVTIPSELEVSYATPINAEGEAPRIDVITTSARGEIKVKPDMATMQIGVVSEASTAKKAEEANRAAVNAMTEAIKKAGLKDEEIKTTNYSIYPKYNYDTRKIIGYTVNTMLELTVNDIGITGDVIDAAVANGANESFGITFGLKDDSAAYNEALNAALEKARAKADIMAKAANVEIAKVLYISDVTTSTTYYNTRADDYKAAAEALQGGRNVSAGMLTVSATVYVDFEIKNK